MKSALQFVISGVLLLGIVFALSVGAFAQGQVSFFTPPNYAGSGTMFVADFNGDGKPDILSGDGTLQLGTGNGTFTTGTPVTGGALAVADFTGNGKADVLQQGTGTLLVLLGNGDGTFQAPIITNSGASLTAIATADLTGNGKADVVGVFNSSLLVYLSKGDGTFAAGVPYNLGTIPPGTPLVILGNFTGNGKTDVAVITNSSGNVAGQVIVLLGNGDGTFQSPKTSTGVFFPNSVVDEDFNGDGKLDLAIWGSASAADVPVVSLLLGNGDGTFQAPTTAFSGGGYLTAADVNGDGNLDLVVEAAPLLEVYLGAGNGTFSGPRSYSNSLTTLNVSSTSSPAVADFNLDGKPDIAAGNYVLLGNGNGTFQGQSAVPLAPAANTLIDNSAAVGDFDKNGTQDVAVISSNAVEILTNDGTGTLTLTQTYGLQQPPYAIATADLNGDGNLDLVVVGIDPITQEWSYSVLLGNGDGTFKPPAFYPQSVEAGGYFSIVIADFNNDHKPDLAIGIYGSQSLAVLLGNGDGTFSSPAYVFDGGDVSLVSADFNGDGNTDLAAAGPAGLAILLGKGDGAFQPAAFPFTGQYGGLLTGDLNGDGKPDLITVGANTGGQVFLGNGDGTFTALAPQPQILALYSLADINDDGKLDVFGTVSHCCGVYLGNGDGTFGPYIGVVDFGGKESAVEPTFKLVADMNGDGLQDLIIGETSSTSGVFVLTNTTPAPPVTNFSPSSVTFPSQNVGSSSNPLPVTLSNTGKGVLNVTAVTIKGTNASEFSQTNNCTTVQPGGKCTVNMVFTPTAAGTASAAVQVADNAGGGTQTVAVSGTGVAAPDFGIGPVSGSQTSQTVSAGQSATFNLAVTPSGSFSGVVRLSCGISPSVTPAPTCSLPSSVNVTAGTAAPVKVMVSTTAPVTAGMVSYHDDGLPRGWGLAWTVVMFGVGLAGMLNRRCLPVIAAPIIVLVFASLVGCGGGSSSSHTTPGKPAGT